MVGMVRRRQERSSSTSSGGKFAFVSLSDPTGEYEVLFPPETLRRCRDLLEPGRAVVLKVRAKAGDGEVRFFGDDAQPLERAIEQVAAGLRIHVSPAVAGIGRAEEAPQSLAFRGRRGDRRGRLRRRPRSGDETPGPLPA